MGNTDQVLLKNLTDKHKPLIDEYKSEQQSQQKSKSAQLPDEIASILASPYGEDKNYLLAVISKAIGAKVFEISEAIRKAWEMFLRPSMEDEPRTSSIPFRMHVTDEDVQQLVRKAVSTNTHSLILDPKVEGIRQQIIELANKIQAVSQQITVNLLQAAQAQTQFIQHLQNTPSIQPLLNIFQRAKHLSSITPPQLLHSSSGLMHQFMLDYALPSFNLHAWGEENIPNPFVHEYKATFATATLSEHPQLKLHAQSYRRSIEEAVENSEHILTLITSLGALTQSLNEILQPKPYHPIPTGGKPTEALRGILEALGNPLPNTDDYRSAQVSLEPLLNQLKRGLRIVPNPDPFKGEHNSERPEPSSPY